MKANKLLVEEDQKGDKGVEREILKFKFRIENRNLPKT